jgi:hypothetical protein
LKGNQNFVHHVLCVLQNKFVIFFLVNTLHTGIQVQRFEFAIEYYSSIKTFKVRKKYGINFVNVNKAQS